MTPSSGCVPAGGSTAIVLTLLPTTLSSRVIDGPLKIKMREGPVLKLRVAARVETPRVMIDKVCGKMYCMYSFHAFACIICTVVNFQHNEQKYSAVCCQSVYCMYSVRLVEIPPRHQYLWKLSLLHYACLFLPQSQLCFGGVECGSECVLPFSLVNKVCSVVYLVEQFILY